MKQWLQTLLQMTTWKRDPSAVYRDLKMMQAKGYVKRIEAFEKNKEAEDYFYREYGGAKGLQFRWRITENGLKRLRMAGLL